MQIRLSAFNPAAWTEITLRQRLLQHLFYSEKVSGSTGSL